MSNTDISESRRAQAEAVAWMARLRAPDRSRDLEAGLRDWLAQSPANSAAFERATDLWEELGGVSAAAVLKHRPDPRSAAVSHRRSWLMAGAASCAAALVAAVGIGFLNWTDEDFSTLIGEQRTVTLRDGSRMALNTDTRVVVEPWKNSREVRLERGEAYFEVAKDPSKPFVVLAGQKKVVALGTAFVVRLEAGRDEKVTITLLEGKVAVTGIGEGNERVRQKASSIATLEPGERLVAARSAPAVAVDRPRLDAVTSWRRGEIVLDNTRLADAIEELNRYSVIRLAIRERSLGELPVSGIFRTGDSDSFATAVSSLYSIAVIREGDRILLAESPKVY